MEEASLKEVMAALKEWGLESNDPRNDGWVQKAYKEKLAKVFEEAGKLLGKNK
jgi:hypothetical protein